MMDDAYRQSRWLAAGILDRALERGMSTDPIGLLNSILPDSSVSVILDGGLPLLEVEHPFNCDVCSYPRSRYLVGASTKGLYVYLSNPDDLVWAFRKEVAFMPAHARDRSGIVGLYRFAISDHEVGADLLAAAYRRADMEQYRRVIDAMRDEVEQVAFRTIADHALGRPSRPVDPMRHVTRELIADTADRSYPERRLLMEDRMPWHPEPWVAFLPGGGVALVESHHDSRPSLGFLKDNVVQWDPPHGVVPMDAVFRPSDERRDPGLLDRFRRADVVPAVPQQDTGMRPAPAPW